MQGGQTARRHPSFKGEAGIPTKEWLEELNTVLEHTESFVRTLFIKNSFAWTRC